MLYAQDIQITDPDVNTFGRNILAKIIIYMLDYPNKTVPKVRL